MKPKMKLPALTNSESECLSSLCDELADFRDEYTEKVACILIAEQELAKAQDAEAINFYYDLRQRRLREAVDLVKEEANTLQSRLKTFPKRMNANYRVTICRDILPQALFGLISKAMNGELREDEVIGA